MKLKSGKELSHLEIIKRLNMMGIQYNRDIIGKKYYIDLYNKAIESPVNIEKIEKDIKKDQMYTDFYNVKLRKRNECSFKINGEENMYNNGDNFIFKNESFCQKQKFWKNFPGALFNKLLLAHFCFTAYNYGKKHYNKMEKIASMAMFPAMKKYTMIYVSPQVKKIAMEVINFVNSLYIDDFDLIVFITFIILFFVILRSFVIKKKSDIEP